MSDDNAWIYLAGVGTMLACTFSNASGLSLQRIAHRKLHEASEALNATPTVTPIEKPGSGSKAGTPTVPNTHYGVQTDMSDEENGILHSGAAPRKRTMAERGCFCASPWWIAGLSAQIIGGLCAVAGIALIGQARCAAFAGAAGSDVLRRLCSGSVCTVSRIESCLPFSYTF